MLQTSMAIYLKEYDVKDKDKNKDVKQYEEKKLYRVEKAS